MNLPAVALLLLYGCRHSESSNRKLISRAQLYKLHTSRWCSHFGIHFVFTFNEWIHCPRNTYVPPQDLLQKLNSRELRVAVFKEMTEFRPDCWPVSTGESMIQQDSYSSYILKILQDVVKFKLRAVPVENLSNRTRGMNGMVGLVAKGSADMAICHLTITASRVGFVDFLHPTLTTSRALVFASSRLSVVEDVFVLTFSGTLWVCFLLALVLLIVCFRFSTWLHSLVRPDHEPWSWVEVVLWAVAAVCQQSYSRNPKGMSCRTTFIIGYLITYLLYTGFAAGVTSLLAVQGRGLHLTLDDVVKMKLTLVATAHTTHHPFIKGPDVSTKVNVAHREKITKAQEVENNEQLFKAMERENIVGFGMTISLENFLWRRVAQNQRREYSISELTNTVTYEALIVQKNSSYKEGFNFWLLKMHESGLLALGRARYLDVPQERCCDAPSWSSASLGNVLSAILILTAGYFFSVIILLSEMAWMRKKTSSVWETRTKEDVSRQYNRYRRLLRSSDLNRKQ